MLKVFQTKGNSNYKQTQHFNEIDDVSTRSFVPLIPVFNVVFHLILKRCKK